MRLGSRTDGNGIGEIARCFLKRPRSGLSSRRKIRQSIMRKTARVFAQARFSTQLANGLC